MHKALLGSLSGLLACAGWICAQERSPVSAPALLPAPGAVTPVPGKETKSNETLVSPTVPAVPSATAVNASCADGPVLSVPGRWYLSSEFLFWWPKRDNLPALATFGRVGDITATAALGQSGTTVIFDGHQAADDVSAGFRVTTGFWIDPEQILAIEASGFYLEPWGTSASAASNGNRALGRPFLNATLATLPNPNPTAEDPRANFPNPEDAVLAATPTITSGSVFISETTQLWGAEANARFNLQGNHWYRADLLTGFRFVQLRDSLVVSSQTQPFPDTFVIFGHQPVTDATGVPITAPPTNVRVIDSFRTRNDFWGGQVGVDLAVEHGIWFANLRGKFALGNVHQFAEINGNSTLTIPGSSTTVVGGLLAQPTNIGRHERNEFGVIPEGGLTVGCQVTTHLRAFFGYSVLYWRNDAIRPSSIIDRAVVAQSITTLAPQPAPSFVRPDFANRPQFTFRDVDFWAQGISAGVEISF